MQDSLIEKIKPYIKNYDAYLVGGYLRDLLSGEISPDRDIAIKCDNLAKLTKKIADELNGSFVELDPVNEIYRVVFGNDYIDFAKLLNNNLDDDIKRRDFTINAIMYDINNEKFVDITGGKKDFEEKIIRTYKISNLSDDPLRTLRAIRFQAKFGFRIDDEIVNFIKENNSLILNVAPERVHQELMKTFEGKFLINALFSMDETGLLDVIFPFFKDIKKIPSNSHHHLDLFHHLIETTRNIRINKPELKLAAFIHDLAKPDCWTIEPETGRHRFIGHDELGAKKVVPFLKKLKFSNKEVEYISKMVQFHIYPSALMKDENVTERAIIRFIRKIGDDTLDLLELARADRLSARGPAVSDEMIEVNLSNLEKLKEKYFEISPKLKEMPKLVDGNEIMQILNLKPSPKLKEIIDEIKELQLEGKINNKEDAINFLKNYKL